MSYNILGTLETITEGTHKYQYQYDNDNRLTAIVNEKGEIYKFERDRKGNIVKEIGFDKMIRLYDLNYAGQITRIRRPGGRYTKLTYDKRGRVIRTDYHDQSFEEFVYGKNGWLDEVKNQYVTVKFERDKLGRIVKEWQNDLWIQKDYGETEEKVELTSCFGANILSKYNVMGQVTHMVAHLDGRNIWAARLDYNALGQESFQQVSGGVISNMSYDMSGRPIEHSVYSMKGDGLRHRRYEWDMGARMKKMTNVLSKGNVIYSYDLFHNLVGEQGDDVPSVFRVFDEMGNLYATKDRSDRIFGEGGRLEVAKVDIKEKLSTYQSGYGKQNFVGEEYYYDEEGNLALKKNPDGSIWEYYYYGNGLLRKIVKPDKSIVIFKYDGLGRRIEKKIMQGNEKSSLASVRFSDLAKQPNTKWESIGGARICREDTTSKQDRIIKRKISSVYAAEVSHVNSDMLRVEKIVRFMWSGKSLLHEWEEDTVDTFGVINTVDFQADYLRKIGGKSILERKKKR